MEILNEYSNVIVYNSVEPMPFDGPFARYFSPPPDGSKPGVFEVNTFHPDQS
jgi:hypothetical protein